MCNWFLCGMQDAPHGEQVVIDAPALLFNDRSGTLVSCILQGLADVSLDAAPVE